MLRMCYVTPAADLRSACVWLQAGAHQSSAGARGENFQLAARSGVLTLASDTNSDTLSHFNVLIQAWLQILQFRGDNATPRHIAANFWLEHKLNSAILTPIEVPSFRINIIIISIRKLCDIWFLLNASHYMVWLQDVEKLTPYTIQQYILYAQVPLRISITFTLKKIELSL
jgi:hypothetical protein